MKKLFSHPIPFMLSTVCCYIICFIRFHNILPNSTYSSPLIFPLKTKCVAVEHELLRFSLFVPLCKYLLLSVSLSVYVVCITFLLFKLILSFWIYTNIRYVYMYRRYSQIVRLLYCVGVFGIQYIFYIHFKIVYYKMRIEPYNFCYTLVYNLIQRPLQRTK